jgi:predicted HicB family RNase H-like nuclease
MNRKKYGERVQVKAMVPVELHERLLSMLEPGVSVNDLVNQALRDLVAKTFREMDLKQFRETPLNTDF